MLGYGKTAQNAIAAVSYLAGMEEGALPASSAVIAKARKLPKPLVAKVLTILSRHGLVEGSTGPGGGYRLAKSAGEISLLDVVAHFDQVETPAMCPLGPEWCGNNDPCPLHETLEGLHQRTLEALASTTFEGFRAMETGG